MKDQNLLASGILVSVARKPLYRFSAEAIGGPGYLGMVQHTLAITSHFTWLLPAEFQTFLLISFSQLDIAASSVNLTGTSCSINRIPENDVWRFCFLVFHVTA